MKLSYPILLKKSLFKIEIMKKIKSEIWDYFEDVIEYPQDVAYKPIPWNVAWNYISSTFLNGFINYVNPIACYVLNRYKQENEDISCRNISVCDRGGFGNWYKFKGTKKQLIDDIISGEKELYHTDLSCFGDDIIVLAEIEDERNNEKGQNKFMFFWFDMDVSDCSIGRIKTDDDEGFVVNSLENWLIKEFKNNSNHESDHSDGNGFYKLPNSFLKGWVKF